MQSRKAIKKAKKRKRGPTKERIVASTGKNVNKPNSQATAKLENMCKLLYTWNMDQKIGHTKIFERFWSPFLEIHWSSEGKKFPSYTSWSNECLEAPPLSTWLVCRWCAHPSCVGWKWSQSDQSALGDQSAGPRNKGLKILTWDWRNLRQDRQELNSPTRKRTPKIPKNKIEKKAVG